MPFYGVFCLVNTLLSFFRDNVGFYVSLRAAQGFYCLTLAVRRAPFGVVVIPPGSFHVVRCGS